MARNLTVTVRRGFGISTILTGGNGSEAVPASAAKSFLINGDNVMSAIALSASPDFTTSTEGGSIIRYYDASKLGVEELQVTENVSTLTWS